MTISRRDNLDTPFSAWIRAHHQLDSHEFNISVQDNDLIIHRFSARDERSRTTIQKIVEHVQFVEIKTFMADQSFAQSDTFKVVDLMLRAATIRNGRRRPIRIPDTRIGRTNCTRSVRWLGCHLLQMSGDRPDTSERMVWDGKHWITEDHLVEILRFDRDPDSPMRFMDTRRHHSLPQRDAHPDLFVVEGGA